MSNLTGKMKSKSPNQYDPWSRMVKPPWSKRDYFQFIECSPDKKSIEDGVICGNQLYPIINHHGIEVCITGYELFEYINVAKMLQVTYTTITLLQSASLMIVQQSTPTIHPLIFYIPMALKIGYSFEIVNKHIRIYYKGMMISSFSLLLYNYFKK